MKLLDLKTVYKGKYLTYYVATYQTNAGKIKEYEFISRDKNLTRETFGHGVPAGVGLVCFNKDKTKVLLQKEFRLATNNWVYNFPAGLIDGNERPEETAKRELKEETGVDLIKVIDVLSPSFASQGTSDEMMYIVICLCEGEITGSCFDEEEIIPAWYSKEEVRKLLNQNEYMSVRTQMFLWQWVNDNE